MAKLGEGEAAERWAHASLAGPAHAPPAAAPRPSRPQRDAKLGGKLDGWAFAVAALLADRLGRARTSSWPSRSPPPERPARAAG